MAGNAFMQQFLKAGLVDEKRLHQLGKEQQKQKKQPQQQQQQDAARAKLAAAQREKALQDAELNRQLHEKQRKQAVAAEIRQLIDAHQITIVASDTPFYFTEAGKIKHIYLQEQQRQQVVAGQLAISRRAGRHVLLTLEIAAKILQRNPDYPMLILVPEQNQTAAVDDPYADYKIPDDLMW
ncbi:MAG: DUF2058 domain-containing protein [Gammaproteobacteria bacterium]|nr:DUF2058 domain-containing protein [Gammaproteobacteria bacterium]